VTGASASIDRVSSTSRAEAGATSWRGRPKRNAAARVHAESDVVTVQIAACAVEKRLPAVALRPRRMPPRIGIVAIVIGVAGDVHAPRLTVVVDPG